MTIEAQATDAATTEAATAQAEQPAKAEQATQQQGAAPTAETAPVEQASKPNDEAAPAAPESYAFKLPEDPASLMTQPVADAFAAVAKTLNLPQDGAQQVLDALAPAIQQAQTAKLEQASTEWAAAVNADPEIGTPEAQAAAKKAADAFCSPQLKELLNTSGMGNHPEMVRMFHSISKKISEDGFIPSQGSRTGVTDPAKRMFPSMN